MYRNSQGPGTLTRLMAAVLTATLTGFWAPAPVFSSERSTQAGPKPSAAHAVAFGGSVFGPDALTVLVGATVKAAHLATGKIFTSQPTGADGQYAINDLPEGTYDIAIESTAGLFSVNTSVEARGGEVLALSFAVGAEEPKSEEGTGDEKKSGDQPEPKADKKDRKGGSFFRTPLGATILLVGSGVAAAALAGAASDKPKSMSP